jgi:hypothetical protein
MLSGIDEADEVGAVVFAHEVSEVFEVEALLVDNLVVVFVDNK